MPVVAVEVQNNSARGARKAFAVTTSDTDELPVVTRALMVTTDGPVNLILADDTTAVVIQMLAGVVYPFRVRQVKSTSTTTTTGIVGLV